MATAAPSLYNRKANEIIQDNYIYISHLDEDIQYWQIPVYPETITDNMSSTFASTSTLGRSAPVFTYSNSGPRSIMINLSLHREMMNDILTNNTVYKAPGEDYMDAFIRALQAVALPKYDASNKAIQPPMVGVRFGKQIFIKGVVSGGINVTYAKPILYNDKYAQVSIGFTVEETDPYDAPTVYANGSFRGVIGSAVSASKNAFNFI